MSSSDLLADAIVIGGGFYGAAIAIYLSQARGLKKIVLIEREASLLARASYNNQARVHNGYHYPRSFTTAYRSRVNLPKFVKDWPDAIKADFTKLYAIPRRNSKVSAKQFERFCREIGARLRPVEAGLRGLFEPRLIEDVFLVEEYAFDSTRLACWALAELNSCGVEVMTRSEVTSITKNDDSTLQISIKGEDCTIGRLSARLVFNCTYSGLNQFGGDFPGTQTGLKHEITEMALMILPPELRELGITVMDGPFFSVMPFPPRGLHTLSHVRYTPHMHWNDAPNVSPYMKLQQYERKTRVDRMIRDASRYLPSLRSAEYVDSLFEVKTVLVKNENDDGRPILFERHDQLPGCYSVLGGKMDNIYDVLERLDELQLPSACK